MKITDKKKSPFQIRILIIGTLTVLVIAIGLSRRNHITNVHDSNQPQPTDIGVKDITSGSDPDSSNHRTSRDSHESTASVISLFRSPPYQEPTPGFVMTRISEGLRQARPGGIPFEGEVEIDSVEQATEHFRSLMSTPGTWRPSYVVETPDWYVFSGWHDTLGNPTTEEIAESHEKLFKRAWAVRKTDGKIFTWNGLTES